MQHRHHAALSNRVFLISLLVLLLSLFTTAQANDRVQTFGQWDAHFMVLPTTMLTPEVAATYGITRANNMAFANIAILDNEAETLTGVRSELKGRLVNLVGQPRNLEFQEVVEGDAVYYIAVFRFPHRERLRFEIDVSPEPDSRTYRLEFAQDIYREDRP